MGDFLLAVLWIFFGGVGLWFASYLWRTYSKQRGWPTVPGRIIERGVGARVGGSGRSHMPHVKYTYSVAGQEYTNDQVYLIRSSGGLANAMQRLVDRLPDPVPVHYDPANPAESYLLANSIGVVLICAGMGIFALGWGLLELLNLVVKR